MCQQEKKDDSNEVADEGAVYRGTERDAGQEREGDTIPRAEVAKKGINRVTGVPSTSGDMEKVPLMLWG